MLRKGTRIIFLILAFSLSGFYGWFAIRGDNRILTIGFIPSKVGYYFDLNPLARNMPAFALLAGVLAALSSGLDRKWKRLLFFSGLAAPVVKDAIQIFVAGRHFDVRAVLLGVIGALGGWFAIRGFEWWWRSLLIRTRVSR